MSKLMTLEEWSRRTQVATGKELDDLGESYGIIRVPGAENVQPEPDDAYRFRMREFVLARPI